MSDEAMPKEINSSESAEQEIPEAHKRCGYVAIIGRPNVGKSTLLNHILGQKLSITSRKPQTTRHRVLGVKTEGAVQAIYVDTPGLHKQADRALNRYMNKAATTATKDVDVILFVVDGMKWTPDDEMVLQRLERAASPVIAVINKVDEIENKEKLLPYLEQLAQKREFAEIIPISALRGNNLPTLEQIVEKYLPEGDFIFPEDQITDRSQRFIAAEIVREKVMRQLGAEVPYCMTVEIEEFKWEENHWLISALILVEKDGQKAIVIGKAGERLKKIGSAARIDMEKMLEAKVMLNLWVKVKSGWADDERALKSLGYNEP